MNNVNLKQHAEGAWKTRKALALSYQVLMNNTAS